MRDLDASTPAVPSAPSARPADLRYEPADLDAVRLRLFANGFTDDQAADLLDHLAVIDDVRNLRAYMRRMDDADLAAWLAQADMTLENLRTRASERPSNTVAWVVA